jgi:hypothetical protein
MTISAAVRLANPRARRRAGAINEAAGVTRRLFYANSATSSG